MLRGEKERKQRSGRVRVGDVRKQQVINCLKSFYPTGAAAKSGQKTQDPGREEGSGVCVAASVHVSYHIYLQAPVEY